MSRETVYLLEFPTRSINYFTKKSKYSVVYKIGKSSDDFWDSRYKAYNSNSYSVMVLAEIYGSEEIIHKKFSHLRIHGEYFLPSEEILNYFLKAEEDEIVVDKLQRKSNSKYYNYPISTYSIIEGWLISNNIKFKNDDYCGFSDTEIGYSQRLFKEKRILFYNLDLDDYKKDQYYGSNSTRRDYFNRVEIINDCLVFISSSTESDITKFSVSFDELDIDKVILVESPVSKSKNNIRHLSNTGQGGFLIGEKMSIMKCILDMTGFYDGDEERRNSVLIGNKAINVYKLWKDY